MSASCKVFNKLERKKNMKRNISKTKGEVEKKMKVTVEYL